MYWLSIISFIAILVCAIIRLSGSDKFEIITADELRKEEKEHLRRHHKA
jgi:hypothetical protein